VRRLAVALLLLYARLVGGEALLGSLVFPLLALEEAAKARREGAGRGFSPPSAPSGRAARPLGFRLGLARWGLGGF
jgi:hypothetical protein